MAEKPVTISQDDMAKAIERGSELARFAAEDCAEHFGVTIEILEQAAQDCGIHLEELTLGGDLDAPGYEGAHLDPIKMRKFREALARPN